MTPLVIKDYAMFTSEEVDFLLEDTLMVLGNSIPFDGTLVMSRKVH